jgi:hypothetical protein
VGWGAGFPVSAIPIPPPAAVNGTDGTATAIAAGRVYAPGDLQRNEPGQPRLRWRPTTTSPAREAP